MRNCPCSGIHSCKPAGAESCAWICIHIRSFPSVSSAPISIKDRKLSQIFESLAAFETSKFETQARAAIHWLDALSIPTRRASDPSPTCSQMLINQNYGDPISLSELAQSEKLDKFRFLRTFKSATGITPYRYLEAIRITRSQHLLRKGARLTECAIQSGFYDLSHFNRCFKARLGVTPGTYRAAYPAANL